MKNNRALWVALTTQVVIGTVGIPLAASTAAAVPIKPNVIVVMTDDQGYGDLSCHGNPVLKTPNLDRLRKQSIRLTDFHVAPMCTPTRGQLLTGVDALRNGAMNVSSGRTLLRREFATMPEIFAANGFRTGIFGKWHLGDNYPYRPQDRGFQEALWFPSSHVSSVPDYWCNDYFDDFYYRNGTRQQVKGYCTDVFFDEAIKWIRQCAGKREPFFCYIPPNAPHGPLFVPDRYREPYRNQKPAIASFFGMIACIDENMGRLMSFLGESGLADNTILIFMTDNGTATGQSVFNAGMRGKKIDLYEGGHRVPFFLRWPKGGLVPASDIDALTQCQDVLPTLLDLCGLRKPSGARFDGISLANLLRGKIEKIQERTLVVQFSRMMKPVPVSGDAAVLWKKWRLVSGNELYDLLNDPGQQSNVISQFPDVAKQMSRSYDQWWQGVKPRVNEFSPISIGVAAEPVLLNPCEWRDVFMDQQYQVRQIERNGSWLLFVEREAEYEFSLRRWPAEANLPIAAEAPQFKAMDGLYPAGKALPIARAQIKVGEFDRSAPVDAESRQVSFRVPLKRGHAELQTWFRDDQGKEICGAYYVYVRRVPGL